MQRNLWEVASGREDDAGQQTFKQPRGPLSECSADWSVSHGRASLPIGHSNLLPSIPPAQQPTHGEDKTHGRDLERLRHRNRRNQNAPLACRLRQDRAGAASTTSAPLDRLPFLRLAGETIRRPGPAPTPAGANRNAPNGCVHPRDIAAMHTWLLADLASRTSTSSASAFGGWIAAEMISQVGAIVSQGRSSSAPWPHQIRRKATSTTRRSFSYLDYPQIGLPQPRRVLTSLRPGRLPTQLEKWDICPRDVLPHRVENLHVQSDPARIWLGGVRTPSAGPSGATTTRVVSGSAPATFNTKALRNATMTTIAECGPISPKNGKTRGSRHKLGRQLSSPPPERRTRRHATVMYFQPSKPMSAYDAQERPGYGATSADLLNTHYDPVRGQPAYNEYLETTILAEDWRPDHKIIDGATNNDRRSACKGRKPTFFRPANFLGPERDKTKRVKNFVYLLAMRCHCRQPPIRMAEESGL